MHEEIIKLAIQEDLGHFAASNGSPRDLSTEFIDSDPVISAQIIAKEAGIMACSEIVAAVFEAAVIASPTVIASEAKQSPDIQLLIKDSEEFSPGDTLVKITGSAKKILICERTILNFLQRFCAIAKQAHKLSQIIKDTNCKLLDTRKTMPGMRHYDKLAFQTGGGQNHRMGLYDMAMLKENHLAAFGEDLIDNIKNFKSQSDKKLEVEINQSNLDKLDAVIAAGADIIMLDNFKPEELPDLIDRVKKAGAQVELSGNITEANILAYAKTGADFISSSSCHTRIYNLDLSLTLSSFHGVL